MLYRNRRGRLVHLNDAEAAKGIEEGNFFPVEQPAPKVEPLKDEVVDVEEVEVLDEVDDSEDSDEPTDDELKALLKEAGQRGFYNCKRETLIEKCKDLELI